MSQGAKLEPYQKHRRPEALDGGQDGTLAVLMEQAFRIKEDVAACARTSQGSVQAEALSRRLLENHVGIITRIVQQLGLDIQTLGSQIAQRDAVTSGTSFAVQSLDQKNAAVVADLRGRVTRCDVSISKLSADVSAGGRRVVRLQQEVTELRAALEEQLKELQVKIHHGICRLEAAAAESGGALKDSQCDLRDRLEQLETKMSAGLRAAEEQRDTLRRWTEEHLHSSARTQAEESEKLRSLLQDAAREAESRLSQRLESLEGRVERWEAQRGNTEKGQVEQLRRYETKAGKRISSLQSSVQQELQLLKQEYHKGFTAVHDAIESLKQIIDIKSRLDKKAQRGSAAR